MNKNLSLDLKSVICSSEEEMYSLSKVQTILKQHQLHYRSQQNALQNTISILDSKLQKSQAKSKKLKKRIRSLKQENQKIKLEKQQLLAELKTLKSTEPNEKSLKYQLESMQKLFRVQQQKISQAIENIDSKTIEKKKQDQSDLSTRIDSKRDLDSSVREKIRKPLTLGEELELLNSQPFSGNKSAFYLNKAEKGNFGPLLNTTQYRGQSGKVKIEQQNAYQHHRKKIFGSFLR